MDQLGSQATLAIIIPLVMQWLKKQTWFPVITVESQNVNRVFSAFVAFVAAYGIHSHFSGGVLTIEGLTWINAWHLLNQGVGQWAMQHFAYKTIVAPALPGAMQYADSTRLGPALPKVNPNEVPQG